MNIYNEEYDAEDYVRSKAAENMRFFGNEDESINLGQAYKAIEMARDEERKRIFSAIKSGKSIEDIEEEINRPLGFF